MPGRVYIGTSGYSYKGWHERFYPQDLREKDLLPFYAERFNSVEINNSFYNVPTPKAVEHWLSQVPKGFQFCFKMSRFLSHNKKLLDPDEPVRRILTALKGAHRRTGPLLLQLPPKLKAQPQRLDDTLAAIAAHGPKVKWRVAIECRDDRWYNDDVRSVLKKHRAALVMHDKPEGALMEDWDTARFVYMRFHGPSGDYSGSYSPARLQQAGEILRAARARGRTVYAFFNNDRDGYAIENAIALRDVIGA